MVQIDGWWVCRSCDPDAIPESGPGADRGPSPRPADLMDLPTTDSGAVRKADAMRWLESLEAPSASELRAAVQPKPAGFTGSTYPTAVSNVRVTGDPKFIETVAGLFTPVLDFEAADTRVELNLQRTEDRETGELTDNYALYLSVAERG